MNDTPSPLIFLSHAAVDHEIAKALKIHLQSALPEVEVFVSSDGEDLKLGDPWVVKILEALDRAKLLLALTTERGLARKWVWFETGRMWFSKVKCIPCCVGKRRKNELPAPFDGLQSANIDEVNDLKNLIDRCSKILELPQTPIDFDLVKDDLVRLDVRAELRQEMAENSFADELTEEVETTMNELDNGSREVLRLTLKYGELTSRVVRLKVAKAGLITSQTMYFQGLELNTGWLVKIRSSPHPNVSRDEDAYKITESIRPYLTAWFEKNK